MIQRIKTLLYIGLAAASMHAFSATGTNRKAPDCQLTALNTEQSYHFQQSQGKVLYVDFWASWCPSCAKSFPYLNSLNQDLKNQGLEIVVVNLDEQLEDAKAFLAKHPSNFTVVADTTKQCAKDFDVEGMPSSYLIDRNGIIRHVHIGFRTGDEQALRVLVEQLLAEK